MPFGVTTSPGGIWSFATVDSGVEVFRGSGGLAAPVLVRRIAVAGVRGGLALTHDGRHLLAAAGSGATVLSVARAEQGLPGAVLGTLRSPGTGTAIEVAVSADDRFAFVTIEGTAQIAVFNLTRALAGQFGENSLVGQVPTGLLPVGLATSPGGRWLYATSEYQRSRSKGGTLAVISVRKAKTDPAHAVVATVPAGCEPTRVTTSKDGRVVWVTARASDMLLGYSAAALRAAPAHSLIARVRVGPAPLALALVDGGTRIVVADSDRYHPGAPGSDLAVVNVPAAVAGKPALAGYLPTGKYPHEMALEPGGRTLLVTDSDSSELESVDVTGLP